MAPLPVENTGRYFVDYQVGVHEHTALIRANAVVSPAGIGLTIDALFTALGPMLFQTTFTRLRWAASGSTVSNPVICGFEGTAYGSGAPSVDDYPRYLDFVGRSAGGRRVRFSLLSVNAALSGFRLTTSESAVIAAAHALIAAPAQAFLAIDGTDPVWYPYANTGFNAYWQRNVRV